MRQKKNSGPVLAKSYIYRQLTGAFRMNLQCDDNKTPAYRLVKLLTGHLIGRSVTQNFDWFIRELKWFITVYKKPGH